MSNQDHAYNAVLDTQVDKESIKKAFLYTLEYFLAKDEYTATNLDRYHSLAYTIRSRLIDGWIHTQQAYHKKNVKR
ncbi:MAG TPA: hypothetical protein PKK26_11210, partial [Candidatus Wallbacteria bacterium]|nr:hypothetical protein [Candidatus Wallbacteria bacterium]